MAQTQNPEFFETRSIPRLLYEFSMPAVVASLVSASYALVARVFVAQRFDTDGVAAVTVAFPVIVVFLAVAMTIGVGATILISIRLGEKQLDKAEEVLGQALFLSTATAALFVFFGLIFIEPILRFTGASDNILPLAKSYLSVLIWGVLPQHIAYGVNNFIRAEGRPRVAMVSMFISAIINGVLDYVFLFVFRTGIWGAGLANVIASCAAASWICFLYFSGRTILRWRLKYFRFNWELTKNIAICGAVPFATQACSAILQTTQNNLLRHYGTLYGNAMGYEFDGGDLAVGMMGTVVAITFVCITPFFGLGQGVQPIAGYNTGAGRPDRVLETIKLALKVAILVSLVFWVAIFFFPEPFVKMFLKSAEIGYVEKLALGKIAIRAVVLAMPLVAVNVLASGYFQAQGRPILALTTTLLRQLIFLLPLLCLSTYVLERFWSRGLDGCWYSFPVSDVLASIVSIIFLRQDFAVKKRQIQEMRAASAPKPAL